MEMVTGNVESPDPQGPSTKLFVGGLPPGVTDEDLRQHFETFGKVDEAVKKQPQGTSLQSHFGFLWVRPAEAARQIIAQDHTIHCASGLSVTIPAPVLARNTKRSGANERTAMRPSPAADHPLAAADKIFVGGLSSVTTLVAYRAFFEEFGSVKDAVIMEDRTTNRSRGFGFVVFDDSASTAAVLSQQAKGGIHIDGKKVEVKPALPKEALGREEMRGGGGGNASARGQRRALLNGTEARMQGRIEFAEGMQHVETYMGYMPPPSADESYVPAEHFGLAPGAVNSSGGVFGRGVHMTSLTGLQPPMGYQVKMPHAAAPYGMPPDVLPHGSLPPVPGVPPPYYGYAMPGYMGHPPGAMGMPPYMYSAGSGMMPPGMPAGMPPPVLIPHCLL